MNQLATIGYEGSSQEDFIATLEAAGIMLVIDIRDVPVSRRKGFSKNALAEALSERSIRYVHLKSLGDPKEGREAARQGRTEEFRRIFGRHLASDTAQQALSSAQQLIAGSVACLLCYERSHENCHRTIVAEALKDRVDIELRHLGVRKGLAAQNGDERPGAGSCSR